MLLKVSASIMGDLNDDNCKTNVITCPCSVKKKIRLILIKILPFVINAINKEQR